MALFDGTGSFGLGLGGFDVSDFMGITGSGGFGTTNFDNLSSFGNGLNNVNTGDATLLADRMGKYESGGGLAPFLKTDTGPFNPTGMSDSTGGAYRSFNPSGTSVSNPNDKTSSSWVDNAVQLGTLANSLYKDYDARKFRNTQYNEYIKDKNDQRAGKKNLIASYYGGADKVPEDNAYYKSTASKGV